MASSSSADPPSPLATSQPLHNFTLLAPWKKNGNPSRSYKRNRSRKSPPQCPYAASASQLRHSPVLDSVAAPPSRIQHPPPPPSPPRFPPSYRFQSSHRDFPAPRPRFFQASPQDFPSPPRRFPSVIRESRVAKPRARFQRDIFHQAPAWESSVAMETNHSEFERLSFLREDRSKGKVPVMAYSRNPYKRSRFSSQNLTDFHKDSSPSPSRVAAAFSTSSNPREALQIHNRSETEIQTKSRARDVNPKIPLFNNELASSSSCTKMHNSCTKETKVEKSSAAETDASGMKKLNDKIKIGDKDDEEEVKVWNLRPRNIIRNNPQMKEKERKKLSIEVSLTKQEIAEDMFALTGAKPSRRPKRHPKNLQKLLDTIFPGLSLLAMTSETYN